LDFNVLVQP